MTEAKIARVTGRVMWMTWAEACAELGLKRRRLSTYVKAGTIRRGEDGLLHAGDVARLAEERRGNQAIAKVHAVANVPTGLSAEDREQLRRAVQVARGNGAMAALPAAGPRPFDAMPEHVYLTVAEAAQYKRVSESWLRARLAGGELPHIALPNRSLRIRKSELDKL